ncbi:hypothetical protein Nmel_010794 [Mimus melanotis]
MSCDRAPPGPPKPSRCSPKSPSKLPQTVLPILPVRANPRGTPSCPLSPVPVASLHPPWMTGTPRHSRYLPGTPKQSLSTPSTSSHSTTCDLPPWCPSTAPRTPLGHKLGLAVSTPRSPQPIAGCCWGVPGVPRLSLGCWGAVTAPWV